MIGRRVVADDGRYPKTGHGYRRINLVPPVIDPLPGVSRRIATVGSILTICHAGKALGCTVNGRPGIDVIGAAESIQACRLRVLPARMRPFPHVEITYQHTCTGSARG